jgi:hypothetical protein
MRNPRNLLIALSMMAVPAVAHKAWAAEADATPAEPAAAAETGADTETGPGPDETAPEPQPKAQTEAPATAGPAEAASKFGGPAQTNHRFQTGLSIMPGWGYRLVVPYKEGQWCGDQSGQANKRVCANSVPFFLDVQLSFGVATRADAILDVRFGLQSQHEISGSRAFALAPGIRFWLDQDVALKFYTSLQFLYEYVDYKATGPRNSDVGMRNANGLMYDPIRNVGFFIQFAETIGMMRWFRIDLDVGLGAQLRFP